MHACDIDGRIVMQVEETRNTRSADDSVSCS